MFSKLLILILMFHDGQTELCFLLIRLATFPLRLQYVLKALNKSSWCTLKILQNRLRLNFQHKKTLLIIKKDKSNVWWLNKECDSQIGVTVLVYTCTWFIQYWFIHFPATVIVAQMVLERLTKIQKITGFFLLVGIVKQTPSCEGNL